METTPVIIDTNNSNIWKWLAGISFTGIAAYFGWKYYFNDPLPDVPDDYDNDSETDENYSEQYGVQIQKFKILRADSWAKKIAAEAKTLGKTFESHLNDIAVSKYVQQGLGDDKELIQHFENKVLEYQIKARQSSTWMASITKKAEKNGISIEQQLRRDAIWMLLTSLIKKYKDQGGGTNNSDQQNSQGNFNGFGGFTISN